MTLPDIPEAAVEAVLRTFLPEGRGFEEAEGEWAREDLTAAWPHLYAAALRHVADVADDLNGLILSGTLRRLADEATA